MPDLVDAIFEAVQREQPAVAAQPGGFDGIEEHIGGEPLVGVGLLRHCEPVCGAERAGLWVLRAGEGKLRLTRPQTPRYLTPPTHPQESRDDAAALDPDSRSRRARRSRRSPHSRRRDLVNAPEQRHARWSRKTTPSPPTLQASSCMCATSAQQTCSPFRPSVSCCSSTAPLIRLRRRSTFRSTASPGWTTSPAGASTCIWSTCVAMDAPHARRKWPSRPRPTNPSSTQPWRWPTWAPQSTGLCGAVRSTASICSAGHGAPRSWRRMPPPTRSG